MPLAHRDAVGGDDGAEELEPLGLAHHGEQLAEPVIVARLDAQAPLPARIAQVVVGFRQLVLAHRLRVVFLDPHREEGRRPLAVRRHARGGEVLVARRLDRREQLLAMQRLELARAGQHDVDVVSPGARLGHGAHQHLVGAGAPRVHLDAVLLLERGDEERQVRLVQ